MSIILLEFFHLADALYIKFGQILLKKVYPKFSIAIKSKIANTPVLPNVLLLAAEVMSFFVFLDIFQMVTLSK